MVDVVPFESEDGADDASAFQDACRNLSRFTWDQEDIEFTFAQIETKMASVGVKKNFTKFQILTTLIPKVVTDAVKPLLRKKETDFPQKDSYKQLKDRILTIFGPRPEAAIERAMSRVLTSTPSELARSLLNDICKHELDCECCPAVIMYQWKKHCGAIRWIYLDWNDNAIKLVIR